MPTPELMTWVASQRRWTRMHNGRRFYVSCRQLGVKPETKESSIRAANAWWTAKEAELNSTALPVPRQPLPMEDLVAAMIGGKPWTSQEDIAKGVAGYLERLPPSKEAETLSDHIQDAAYRDEEQGDSQAWDALASTLGRWLLPKLLERTIIDGKPLPESVADPLPPARVNQLQDAVKAIRGEQAAQPERTVAAHAAAWIADQEKQAAAGRLTAARVNNVRMALAHFIHWLGESADVANIDAAKLQGFYGYCNDQIAARRKDKNAGWSLPFAKEVFAVARSWIRWLTEQGTIDPPRNLASKFRFGSTAKKIATWTVDEVQRVIREAPGKLRLGLLLMVNCGMTQMDVSDLADDEVNWTRGTITRRRSKTKHNENVPVVTYRLWGLTWHLLQQYRSGSERVLLTASGLPYVRNEMVNGKLKKADGFTSNYAHLKRRLKFTKSMKLLRKTAATLLESHPTYGRLVPHFLGHSPRGVAAKHYASPSQELFNQAVRWLGQQFGFVE